VHTHRRNAVLAAVQRSDAISPAIASALSLSLPICFSLAVQIMQGWCELGSAPANLERTPGVVEQLYGAVLQQDTCSAAAECLSTLFASHKAKRMGSVALEPLLQALLQALLPWLGAYKAAAGEGHSKEVHVAACSVCCAAASSALLPTLAGHVQLSALLQPVLEHLLACLSSAHVDVSGGLQCPLMPSAPCVCTCAHAATALRSPGSCRRGMPWHASGTLPEEWCPRRGWQLAAGMMLWPHPQSSQPSSQPGADCWR
jgi:hypothetical protein